jgi:hypothetical protein
MAVFSSLDDHGLLFSTGNTPSVLGTATIDFVHIALVVILLIISKIELVFTLLAPWLSWQPWRLVPGMAYGHMFVS